MWQTRQWVIWNALSKENTHLQALWPRLSHTNHSHISPSVHGKRKFWAVTIRRNLAEPTVSILHVTLVTRRTWRLSSGGKWAGSRAWENCSLELRTWIQGIVLDQSINPQILSFSPSLDLHFMFKTFLTSSWFNLVHYPSNLKFNCCVCSIL